MNDADSAKAVFLSLVLVLLVAGCEPGAPAGSAREVEFRPSVEPAGRGSPGATADTAGVLHFTAPRLGGGKVVGSELAGQNLAVWFWAPW